MCTPKLSDSPRSMRPAKTEWGPHLHYWMRGLENLHNVYLAQVPKNPRDPSSMCNSPSPRSQQQQARGLWRNIWGLHCENQTSGPCRRVWGPCREQHACGMRQHPHSPCFEDRIEGPRPTLLMLLSRLTSKKEWRHKSYQAQALSSPSVASGTKREAHVLSVNGKHCFQNKASDEWQPRFVQPYLRNGPTPVIQQQQSSTTMYSMPWVKTPKPLPSSSNLSLPHTTNLIDHLNKM